MRKGIMVLTAVAVMSVSGLALAEMEGKKEGMGKGMMGKMGMMHDMKGMMNKPSMVAGNDGGVIILSGNKLSKYDSRLNLVKEVEIKSESKDCNMCDEMKSDGKGCAMCEKMKGEGKGCGMCQHMMGGHEEANKAEAAPATKEADHKAHH